MGYKDILVIKEKEHRDLFLFIILLTIASILTQFEFHSVLWWRGAELLSHVSNTLIIYFVFSFIFRDTLNKYSYLLIPLSWLLSFPFNFFLTQTIIGEWIWVFLTIFTLFYYIFITAAFSMNDTYNSAVKWDEKVGVGTKSSKNILRWLLFFGGTAVSIVLLYFSTIFILDFQYHSLGFKSIILSINFFMILYISLFFGISIIALFFKKSYLWFGMYFLFVTIYAIKLMIDFGRYEYTVGGEIVGLEIFSLVFSIYLLLTTFGDLMGEKSDIIGNKLRIVKPRTLSIWLIYSLAETLYAPDLIGDFELWMLGYLYPFFVGVFGFYAIYVYNKKSKLKKESKDSIVTYEPEKPETGPKQKSKLKEEKKLVKLRKNLEKKIEYADYLIKKNNVETALKNLREVKEESEKNEFLDLVLKVEEKIEYCKNEISKI